MKRRLVVIAVIAFIAVVAVRAMQSPQYQLALVDRSGHKEVLGVLPSGTFAVRVAPNGRQAVFDTDDGREAVIWIYELTGNHSMRRLVSGGSRFPMWSGNGERILYLSETGGEPSIFWQRADGTGTPEKVAASARAPESWSVQNQMFSFITAKGADYDIWTYSLSGKKAAPLIEGVGSAQHSSAFSPDGRWIAYMSDASGRAEVYVRPFPIDGNEVRVSKGGGTRPMWSPDGRELFFDNAGRIFSVNVRLEPVFSASGPVQLPISEFIQGPARRQYDLMPDGKRFLMLFRF